MMDEDCLQYEMPFQGRSSERELREANAEG